jgi:hypothetical protein
MPKIPRWEPDDALMEKLPDKEEYEAYKRETLGLAHSPKTEEEENADRRSFVRQMMGFSQSEMYRTLMGRGREPEVLVLPAQKVCQPCRDQGVVGICEHRSGQYPPGHGPSGDADALLSEMQKDEETYERESLS